MSKSEIEFREMFRVILFENRLNERIPIKVIIESVTMIFFPKGQDYIIETFQSDMAKFLKPFSNEYEELTETKFIEAMVD